MIADQYFVAVIVYTILQRISEMFVAKRNTTRLVARGAVEFGASHYPVIVLMHVAFFVSLGVEYIATPVHSFYPVLLSIFVLAQVMRFWVMRVLGERWSTRVLVVAGETLVAGGPYRYLSHPNYLVVAIEILVLPLAFGLWVTAAIFSVLNAILLLLVRIPIEKRALIWSQGGQSDSRVHASDEVTSKVQAF